MKKKDIPAFRSEAEEQAFWANHDSTEYVDWKRGRRRGFHKLAPSLKTISLRLPEMLLEELKLLANKRDVPYQSLLKIYLAERVDKELRSLRRRPAPRSRRVQGS